MAWLASTLMSGPTNRPRASGSNPDSASFVRAERVALRLKHVRADARGDSREAWRGRALGRRGPRDCTPARMAGPRGVAQPG